ncbi:MAG TPA: DMT family transporter [Chryseolinea sp.]|nr:DMT family transporter [Chryseolinea sp.]
MKDSPSTIAILLLLLLSLIWGTSYILIKQGLKVFDANEVGALRVAVASLFLLPVAVTRVKELKHSDYWKLLASGLMGVFIPAFLFATAQTQIDSSVAGILNSLTPLFTMIIGSLIFKQKFGTLPIIGILLGFGGVLILVFNRSGGNIGQVNFYALLIVFACFLYASNINLIKFKIPDLPSITITSVSILFIGPLAFVYLFAFTDFTQKFSTHAESWKALGFIALLGLMSTAIAILILNRLVKMTSPMFVSSVNYIVPIVSVMWGVVDGEKLEASHFIGMAAIIGGVYLANYKKS